MGRSPFSYVASHHRFVMMQQGGSASASVVIQLVNSPITPSNYISIHQIDWPSQADKPLADSCSSFWREFEFSIFPFFIIKTKRFGALIDVIKEREMGLSDNSKGVILAVASSAFIGSSFILKKKGLKRAGATGTRAGVGGYTYLLEPLWWAGMITMIIGEVANFVAYVYAPAVLVTPLGALSIIVSAFLAHFMLKERVQKMGIVGCVSCIVGSVVIVIHAPQEHTPSSVLEIWTLATQPAFLIYVAATLSTVLALVLHFEPRYGQTNLLVYLGICSLMGSLTVVSIKAIGIAIKLTLDGISQLAYPQTWFFITVAAICVITQLNYLNKALDTFNAAIVSPVYYVMFTTLTIIASVIMFKDWSGQNVSSIASEICGFITVLSGTIILHATREQEPPPPVGTVTWYVSGDSVKSPEDEHLITLRSLEYYEP
ncbi:Non-imprinted in Prader-Willi/Angelman syndrome region protein [Theobroma cacao]|uniref:Probable magnesium transporter n=1 Tax=Theobroma cacao TaxID=3641 RepID=A0A061DYJ3_THECC|nr:Non-imprinted in Prader-Willi/Angelman syndrome region protein [Theobroma cacao]